MSTPTYHQLKAARAAKKTVFTKARLKLEKGLDDLQDPDSLPGLVDQLERLKAAFQVLADIQTDLVQEVGSDQAEVTLLSAYWISEIEAPFKEVMNRCQDMEKRMTTGMRYAVGGFGGTPLGSPSVSQGGSQIDLSGAGTSGGGTQQPGRISPLSVPLPPR